MKTLQYIFLGIGFFLLSSLSIFAKESYLYVSDVAYDPIEKRFEITYCSNWSGTLGATNIQVRVNLPRVIRINHKLENGFWEKDDCDVISFITPLYKSGKTVTIRLNSVYGNIIYRGVPVIDDFSLSSSSVIPVSQPILNDSLSSSSVIPVSQPILNDSLSILDEKSVKLSGNNLTYSFLTSNTSTNGFKRYAYIPQPGTNPNTLFGTLNLNNWKYSSGDFYSSENKTYTTRIHGYKIEKSDIEQAMLLFGQNGYSTLFSLSPITKISLLDTLSFEKSKLSDNTYRNFYLYVNSANSEAYLIQSVQSLFQ